MVKVDLMCWVESVEDIIRVVFHPPGLPDLLDTPDPLGTLTEALPVEGDHGCPVTGVRTAADTARQLVEVDWVSTE